MVEMMVKMSDKLSSNNSKTNIQHMKNGRATLTAYRHKFNHQSCMNDTEICGYENERIASPKNELYVLGEMPFYKNFTLFIPKF